MSQRLSALRGEHWIRRISDLDQMSQSSKICKFKLDGSPCRKRSCADFFFFLMSVVVVFTEFMV